MMLPLAGVFAGLGATGLQGNAWFSVSGHVERVERPEMIAGPTGRHNRCDEAKARIVLESHAPGARVVDVARRHGVAAQQVTAWRRDARQGKLALPAEDEAAFAMLALDVKAAAVCAAGDRARRRHRPASLLRLARADRGRRRSRRRSPAQGAIIVPAQGRSASSSRQRLSTRPRGLTGWRPSSSASLGRDPHSGLIVVRRAILPL
jgi:transposase-like protein